MIGGELIFALVFSRDRDQPQCPGFISWGHLSRAARTPRWGAAKVLDVDPESRLHVWNTCVFLTILQFLEFFLFVNRTCYAVSQDRDNPSCCQPLPLGCLLALLWRHSRGVYSLSHHTSFFCLFFSEKTKKEIIIKRPCAERWRSETWLSVHV